jgi:hypothetical protein
MTADDDLINKTDALLDRYRFRSTDRSGSEYPTLTEILPKNPSHEALEPISTHLEIGETQSTPDAPRNQNDDSSLIEEVLRVLNPEIDSIAKDLVSKRLEEDIREFANSMAIEIRKDVESSVRIAIGRAIENLRTKR